MDLNEFQEAVKQQLMPQLVFCLFGNDGCGEDSASTPPLPGNYSRLNIVSDSFRTTKTFLKADCPKCHMLFGQNLNLMIIIPDVAEHIIQTLTMFFINSDNFLYCLLFRFIPSPSPPRFPLILPTPNTLSSFLFLNPLDPISLQTCRLFMLCTELLFKV